MWIFVALELVWRPPKANIVAVFFTAVKCNVHCRDFQSVDSLACTIFQQTICSISTKKNKNGLQRKKSRIQLTFPFALITLHLECFRCCFFFIFIFTFSQCDASYSQTNKQKKKKLNEADAVVCGSRLIYIYEYNSRLVYSSTWAQTTHKQMLQWHALRYIQCMYLVFNLITQRKKVFAHTQNTQFMIAKRQIAGHHHHRRCTLLMNPTVYSIYFI